MEIDYYLKKIKDLNFNLIEFLGWDYYKIIECSLYVFFYLLFL